MQFKDLINYLERDFHLQLISHSHPGLIQEVHLLDGQEKNFSEDVLYMGQLPKGNLPTHAIFTGQLERVQEGKNLAKLPGKELFAAYNACRKLFEQKAEGRLVENLESYSLKAKSLESFINQGARLLNNPLILMDQDYKIVAYSKEFLIQDPLWSKTVDRGYCRYPLIKASEGSAPYRLAQASREAYLGEMCDHTPGPKIYSKIYSQGAYWGAILLLEERRPITYEDYQILPRLSQMIEHMITRLQLQPRLDRAQSDRAFYRLLVGAPIEDLDLDKTQLQLQGQFVTLALETLEEDPLKTETIQSIRTYFPTAHFAKLKDTYVFLLPLGSGEAFPLEALAYFRDLAQKEGLTLGISNPFQDLNQLMDSYHQAQYALTFPSNHQVGVYSLTSLGKLLEDFQKLSLDPVSWKDYIHPALGQLKSYDKIHQSALYETLDVYLKSSGNVKETAAKLFMHRNSVKYRLDQIRDLCQLDLTQGTLRFHLGLSYYIEDCIKEGLLKG